MQIHRLEDNSLSLGVGSSVTSTLSSRVVCPLPVCPVLCAPYASLRFLSTETRKNTRSA